MKKAIVELKLDYMQGPIWISDVETGEPLTGIDVIDNDLEVKKLNYQIYGLYDSFFEYDSSGIPIGKKEDRIRKEKKCILDLVKKLISRLDKINDGSYEIKDNVSDEICKL